MSNLADDDAPLAAPELTTPEQWHDYLREYSETYLRTADPGELSDEQIQHRWVGHEPAAEQTVVAAEQRLAIRFPPTFRSFLAASDGWPNPAEWVDELHASTDVAWFRDTMDGAGFIDLYGEPRNDDEDDSDMLSLFRRSLVIASGEDFWLLDPADPGPDGEWVAWEFTPKYGGLERFANFAEIFHASRVSMEQEAADDDTDR
ncbi:SMI1/KNR4 family protein [Frankia gtarii]|uniref:SMI1/KNR4 family protein n=1 Tax=Frankia gtarii TaxID=2950102 RepID=UPI0021BF7CF4|nr:SMI1/KNR4 family protein [Frankia gtarii]